MIDDEPLDYFMRRIEQEKQVTRLINQIDKNTPQEESARIYKLIQQVYETKE